MTPTGRHLNRAACLLNRWQPGGHLLAGSHLFRAALAAQHSNGTGHRHLAAEEEPVSGRILRKIPPRGASSLTMSSNWNGEQSFTRLSTLEVDFLVYFPLLQWSTLHSTSFHSHLYSHSL